jgi:monoamine oxidase
LANAGEAAVAGFIADEFAARFGGGTRQAPGKIELTRWSKEPWVQGGVSAAAPGAAASRRTLMQPIYDRVFLAGEAAHETLWGTIAGAALSGERAADAALRYLGPSTPQEPQPPKPGKRR